MSAYENSLQLLKYEVKQRAEEGCDVSGWNEKIAAVELELRQTAAASPGDAAAQIDSLYQELVALPIQPGFSYVEPSDLESIREQRPDGPRRLEAGLNEEAWVDKFKGAWLGRCAGCALGKPVEAGDFMHGSHGNPGWKNIQLWFEGADAWPIRGYTPEHSRAQDEPGLQISTWSMRSTREHIRFMESDDDIRYTVLGLKMLEDRGLDWNPWDIGELWQNELPINQVFTAERQAYLNFANYKDRQSQKADDWLPVIDWVRTYHNPFREWIGAQIRADGWAYGAAGQPELAAELAWRDASFSHVKNGIYGEMFAAAAIAAAFVVEDAERAIEIGLSEIPRRCRLAEDISKAVDIARQASSQLELVSRVWEAFKHYDPVHTNNNAALVAAALVFARGDYETAITTAVLGGWDTDCNGATAGSLMGALLGARALPAGWIDPLNDTLYAQIHGFHPIAISECAQRSQAVYKKLKG
jgi:ADP-ribosylglycohydrolase